MVEERHRAAARELRRLRITAVICVAWVVLVPTVVFFGVELYDWPRSWLAFGGVPASGLMYALRQLTKLECPDCGRLFSVNERSGTHLTNKRCAHCGLLLAA